MNIEIANRLFEMRKKSNLSQEELAAKIGVSRQAVSKWERAESSPDTDNLIELAQLYEVSLDDLLFTDEPITRKDEGDKTGQEFVSIGLDGIHVIEKDGSEVHVSMKGIQVKNAGSPEFEDGIDELRRESGRRFLYNVPVSIIAAISYLVMGFCYGLWHPSWLVFFVIPVYYQVAAMATKCGVKKKLNFFPLSIICVVLYLYAGFCYDLWHPTWIVFLAIPFYHSLVNIIFRSKHD